MTGADKDTRGIVDPSAMLRHVVFERHPAGDRLNGLIDWFWSVAWSLPDGYVHDQRIITHPAAQISIGTVDDQNRNLDPAEGRVYGVNTTTDRRILTGDGWTVAAKVSPGALGLFLERPARELTDRRCGLDEVGGLDPAVVDNVRQVPADADAGAARCDELRRALELVLDRRDGGTVEQAREVAALARLAEVDRTICRTEHLAETGGYGVRAIQRLFDQHVGASPSFLIRRWRIIEAVESAKQALRQPENGKYIENDRPKENGEQTEGWRGWAAVAAELGYADQAHLTRDFTRWVGCPPSEYVRRQQQADPAD